MKNDKPIIGAGGGIGGKGAGVGGVGGASVPQDNLNSRQYARILELISEGEIDGFPSARSYNRTTENGEIAYRYAALKDIFLDNTAILQADAIIPTNGTAPASNKFNFQGVNSYLRFGTQNQDWIRGFKASETPYSVNSIITFATPVVRTVTDTNVDAVRVTISVPQLQWFNANGTISGAQVNISVQLSYDGAPYTDDPAEGAIRSGDTRMQFNGRTADLYQRSFVVDFLKPWSSSVAIKIIRETPDAGSPPDPPNATRIDKIYWATYSEVRYSKLRYPNSALVGFVLPSEQFNSIPSRAFRIRGIKVQIPSNARPALGPYGRGALIFKNEPWDGTFTQSTSGGYTWGGKQWTSDPAWILWDLLTNKRYGFGDHIQTSKLDKWAFYEASQYCSARNTYLTDGRSGTTDDYDAQTGKHGIDDGTGVFEPRFSCSVNIQTQEEAYKLINDMCSTFRAMPFWSTGALALAQDRPTDFSYCFSPANVINGDFTYSGSSLKTRHTVVQVSYMDLDARDVNYEVVEDAEAIAKYGVIKADISAFACTSRGQARRIGEWMLYSEQNETNTISFQTSADAGIMVRPGDVVQVYDPVISGERRGGRVKTATTTQILIDDTTQTVLPNLTQNPVIRVLLPDGTFGSSRISDTSGNIVFLETALVSTPQPGAPFVISSDDVRPTLWRVLSVTEEEGALYTITGLAYSAQKYDYVERHQEIPVRDITNLNVPPPATSNIQAAEYLYESNGQVVQKIIVSWQPVPQAYQYRFRYRVTNGNWTTAYPKAPEYEILGTEVGRYEFEITTENSARRGSNAATATFDAIGKTAPPSTIPDLFIAPIDDKNAELYWPQATDIDVKIGGQIRIRHSPLADGTATWGQSNDIVPAVAGSSTRKIVPLLEGTYFIRAVDSTGNESAGTASVIVDLPAPQDTLLIQEYREEDNSPPFNGTTNNMSYNEEEIGLILASDTLVDDMATDGDWDALGLIDYIGGAASEGSYIFAETLDLGGTYDIDLRNILKTRAYEPGNLWDDRLENIDLWDDIDGDDLGAANCQLYVRTTTDNPSGSPTWGEWQPFVNNTTRGRGFQFKLIATSNNPAQNVVVEELGVITQFQRRVESERNKTSGAAAYAVTFPTAFYGTPSIGITAQDMGTGDYFTVSSISRTGFTVTFRNSGGSMVSKVFDYQAVGHGRQIT